VLEIDEKSVIDGLFDYLYTAMRASVRQEEIDPLLSTNVQLNTDIEDLNRFYAQKALA
jgi:hypothetical protein